MRTILLLVLFDTVSDELDASIHLSLALLGSNEYIRITQQPSIITFVTPDSIDVHLTIVPFAVELEQRASPFK